MAARDAQLAKAVQPNEADLRIFPFLVAGVVCFTFALLLGSGSWYVFGSNKQKNFEAPEVILPSPPEVTAEKTVSEVAPTPETQPETPAKFELKGLIEVSGGEIAIGGGESKLPLKRAVVEKFSMAETEITNSQYSEFIKDSGHKSPNGWSKGKFPKGSENFPVTNVSFEDALAFCQWLEKKSGLPVRLPTEAEWEFAARGTADNKYPWGNEWNSKNAVSKETGGKVSPVKSFEQNRSVFGVYDLAGNVWEWTQDKVGKNDFVTDEAVKQALKQGKKLRIVKGGSAQSEAKEISIQARYEIPENTKVPSVGFRYVVVQKPNE